MNDETTFGKRLSKLNELLSFHVVTKDEGKAKLMGDTLILKQYSAGDIVINYDGEPILEMVEINGMPAIRLDVRYVGKDNSAEISAKMFADLVNLCDEYLPEEAGK